MLVLESKGLLTFRTLDLTAHMNLTLSAMGNMALPALGIAFGNYVNGNGVGSCTKFPTSPGHPSYASLEVSENIGLPFPNAFCCNGRTPVGAENAALPAATGALCRGCCITKMYWNGIT
ncbi:hypothetical protein CFIMG_005578RA [Ceratocystis fimbriata CBS 114723]|uniref:Uncharacterized protein n=1 Tax=Ceratocystis fimbriata CBS 114723 TaxID=1035309 RepID=A0A2C5X4L5_9PEZI|nr:hypothetical protein CFIMG_005578RA [Ceratocystis fimbriata CBS 114723]